MVSKLIGVQQGEGHIVLVKFFKVVVVEFYSRLGAVSARDDDIVRADNCPDKCALVLLSQDEEVLVLGLIAHEIVVKVMGKSYFYERFFHDSVELISAFGLSLPHTIG